MEVSGLGGGISKLVAGYEHTCAVTATGGGKCWGDNSYGQLGDGTIINRSTPMDAKGLTSNATTLATGSSYTCVVVSGGRPKCWGSETDGQFGIGTVVLRQ